MRWQDTCFVSRGHQIGSCGIYQTLPVSCRGTSQLTQQRDSSSVHGVTTGRNPRTPLMLAHQWTNLIGYIIPPSLLSAPLPFLFPRKVSVGSLTLVPWTFRPQQTQRLSLGSSSLFPFLAPLISVSGLPVFGSPPWHLSAFMLSWFPWSLSAGEVGTTPSS